MCNAASKILALLALVPVASLCACGPDADREAAERLVAQAQGAMDRSQFDSAFIFLDSLSTCYPRQIEAGRQGLALRPRAMVGKTQQEIMEMQVLLQDAKQAIDSLMPLFRQVARTENLPENFYYHTDAPDDFRERNTAVARVSPSGEFIMVSSLAGRTTHHTAISLKAAGREATSGSVPFDDSLPLSRESVRFASGAADAIGDLACEADGTSAATIAFIGGKSIPKAKLTAKELHAIADSRRLASAISAYNELGARMTKLKAKLQLARDQSVNTENQ